MSEQKKNIECSLTGQMSEQKEIKVTW